MTALLARRLALQPGETASLCARLGLRLPPGIDRAPRPISTAGVLMDGVVPPALAAGLAVTCAPRVGVHVSTLGGVAAAFGIRGELGASVMRVGEDGREVSAWSPLRLGEELARCVPPLGTGRAAELHLPLADVARSPGLVDAVLGTLRATVVAPPHVMGHVVWLATASGWLSLEPAEVRDGVRWAVVRPVAPADLGACVAPFVGAALS
ncbi:MAG: hypothetical protein JWP11_1550 [Frankiales bacterium]|nr:hypothetical protein [Frankiales bacterium]